MKKKAVVLLSAGLDSSVNLFAAQDEVDVVLALTFDYSQKAAKRETEAAKKLAAHAGVPHQVVRLDWFKDFNRSSLLVEEFEIPAGPAVDVQSHERSIESAKSVWVPNRNGIFLNIAAAYAESLNADIIIPGFNVEEAATFPDNSVDYMKALTSSLYFSTANHVRVECYTAQLDKVAIVKKGIDLKVPWNLLWPCYFAGELWCGECESCQRAKRAFTKAGVNVEKLYANSIC